MNMRKMAVLTILLVVSAFSLCFGDEGLVGYWSSAGVSGDVCADLSGNGFDADVFGIPGGSGEKAGFAGKTLKVDSDPLLMPTSSITISAWVKTSTPLKGFQTIYRKEDGQGRQLLMIQHDCSIIAFGVGTSIFGANTPEYTEFDVKIAPSQIADNNWHLVTASYDGQKMGIYLDSRLIGDRDLKGVMFDTGDMPAYIGSTSGVGEFFTGSIEDVKLYSRALDADEIAAAHAAGISSEMSVEQIKASIKRLEKVRIEKQQRLLEQKKRQDAAIAKWNKYVADTYLEPVDLEGMAANSMKNYMTKNAEPLKADPSLMAVHFLWHLLPEQAGGGPLGGPFGGWDFGDATSRSVCVWPGLREMTGDYKTGLAEQRGNQKFVLELLNEKTGLAITFDKHNPHKDSTHYGYFFDQSRTIRAMARWYMTEPRQRKMLKPWLDKYLRGLSDAADINGTDPKWGKYSGFSADSFKPDGTLEDKKGGWIHVRAGVTLEGVVDYLACTDDEFALDLAKRFAACTAGGYEGDVAGADAPANYRFGPNGEFIGHVHTRTGVITGLLKLAKYLYTHGEKQLGDDYLQLAKKSYDWMLREDNPSRASKCGWWPEGIGGHTSEVCCIVDAIENAELLGGFAHIDPQRYKDYASYYDDAESFTVNTLIRAYIRFTPELENLLKAHWQGDVEAKLKKVRGLEGSFSAAFNVGDMTRPAAENKRELVPGGCCVYSGMRGLHAGWRAAMGFNEKDKTLRINYFINRNSDYASITTTQPKSGSASIKVKQTANNVLIRVPYWLKPSELTIKTGKKTVTADKILDKTGHYADLGKIKAGSQIKLTFPYEMRKVVDKFARDTYRFDYRGNYVVKMLGGHPYMRTVP